MFTHSYRVPVCFRILLIPPHTSSISWCWIWQACLEWPADAWLPRPTPLRTSFLPGSELLQIKLWGTCCVLLMINTVDGSLRSQQVLLSLHTGKRSSSWKDSLSLSGFIDPAVYFQSRLDSGNIFLKTHTSSHVHSHTQIHLVCTVDYIHTHIFFW